MPNKISLTEIQNKLPSFVKIIPETYKGIRYQAKFVDLDYGKEFSAIVGSVIKLQHGCKERADKRRREATKGREKGRIPLQEIIAQLPPYLTIDPATYKGVREKATFTDTELKETFEGLVCNVLRHGKGYCKKRKQIEFSKSITLTPKEIQDKLDLIYGLGKVILIPESYSNTQRMAQALIEGKQRRLNIQTALAGKLFCRRQLDRWKAAVNARDWFKCQKCGHSKQICAHHIKPWASSIEDRFNVHNGITLCDGCHNAFHAQFKNQETPENLCEFFGFNLDKIKERLAEPKLIPPA